MLFFITTNERTTIFDFVNFLDWHSTKSRLTWFSIIARMIANFTLAWSCTVHCNVCVDRQTFCFEIIFYNNMLKCPCQLLKFYISSFWNINYCLHFQFGYFRLYSLIKQFLLFPCPFYPRDAMLARVIEIATCLSVCPSVTRRYCVKTKKASGMISSPSVSPKTLVFRRQISSPNSKGFPPNWGLKQGSVVKIQRFASCNVSISSTGYTNQSQSQSLHCYII